MKPSTNKESYKTIAVLMLIFVLIASIWYAALYFLNIDKECNTELLNTYTSKDSLNHAMLYSKMCRDIETINISIAKDTLYDNLQKGVIFSAYADTEEINKNISCSWLTPSILNIKYSVRLKVFRKVESFDEITIIYENFK